MIKEKGIITMVKQWYS